MKRINLKTILLTGTVIISTILSCTQQELEADAYGNFEAREIIVPSQATGILNSFTIKEGDILKVGEKVGWVDTTRLFLQKKQLFAQIKTINTKYLGSRAEISVLEAEKSNLTREKKRFEKLLADGAVTSKQMDDINGNLNVLNKKINAVRTQLKSILAEKDVVTVNIDMVNDQIVNSIILNPESGTVLEKYLEQYEIVVPGKALYKLADLNNMILKAYISEPQLSEIELQQKVNVLIDGINEDKIMFEGIVIWISSEAEFTPKIIQTREERVNLVYAIKVRVKNDGRIKIGMPGEVRFKKGIEGVEGVEGIKGIKTIER
ncbi:MAG: HlyD family efflux transporter periplasmic adaptor subunit [Bacteroidales bacterium]|nr:HlyD family efflux transporter periplasmic adaptor subunit [Bacteroidales bacterium]